MLQSGTEHVHGSSMTQLALSTEEPRVGRSDEWKDERMAVKWVVWKVVHKAVDLDMHLGI